jgi:hypothetical protein
MVLAVGCIALIIVLLNPVTRDWVTFTPTTDAPIFNQATEYGPWIGRILAVIVATALAWYFTRAKSGGDKPPS